MSKNLERRAFFLDQIKVERRADNKPKIVGHAAVFNSLSENLGGFREQISPGAFERSIKEDDVRALIEHDPKYIIGRNTAGTLKLSEDSKGLAIEIDPPDTSFAHDLLASLERGDITQMSFGFRVRANGQNWGEDEDGNVIRTLTDVKLMDVSTVAFPAYPETDVAKRSLEEWRAENSANAEGQDGDQPTLSNDHLRRQVEIKEKQIQLEQ